MDITMLFISLIFIAMGPLGLIDAKRANQPAHTWLGQKAWPVRVRVRFAIAIFVCGILLLAINLCAWAGFIKL